MGTSRKLYISISCCTMINHPCLPSSVATCANWALNVLFSQVSNLAIANISWKYYLVFICLNAIDFVIIILFFPETKGMVLLSC